MNYSPNEDAEKGSQMVRLSSQLTCKQITLLTFCTFLGFASVSHNYDWIVKNSWESGN